jgi:Restriction endonuclease BglII.
VSCRELPDQIRDRFEVKEWRHACAILRNDFPQEWADMVAVLSGFRLRTADILAPGGGKSPVPVTLDQEFTKLGWYEKKFDTVIEVDGRRMESPTHKIDCFKNQVALEIEWNNKDPFFDRDLNNFRLLFELRAISVGVIITKADSLRSSIESLGSKVWNKYGMSTTWTSKLLPRIEGGGGGGCPILVFGITERLLD